MINNLLNILNYENIYLIVNWGVLPFWIMLIILPSHGVTNFFVQSIIVPLILASAYSFVSALKLCKRRRIGPLRPQANRELFYKKDMGILARGGFNFDLSKRVLNLDINEFNKLLKIV